MLLTGVDQHKNGYGTMGEYLDSSQRQAGLRRLLESASGNRGKPFRGFRFDTYMTGKWYRALLCPANVDSIELSSCFKAQVHILIIQICERTAYRLLPRG